MHLMEWYVLEELERLRREPLRAERERRRWAAAVVQPSARRPRRMPAWLGARLIAVGCRLHTWASADVSAGDAGAAGPHGRAHDVNVRE